MSHHLLLIVHLLGACVWVGGHLILSLLILPEVLRDKKPELLLNFEKKYEKVGIPALFLMVITGIWMSYQFGVTASDWFHFSNPIETAISIKIIILLVTFLLALSANFLVLPRLSVKTLPLMAFHIISVTILGVLLLLVGSFIRFGGINL